MFWVQAEQTVKILNLHLKFKIIIINNVNIHNILLIITMRLQAWSDLKTKTKQKNVMLRKNANKTGGGPSSGIVMNSVEDQIISLINPTTISGHQNVSESATEFNIIENTGAY